MAGARCVVFDVRGCGEGNDRQLLLFWLRATREAIPYEVERSPLSVVSVHDGFYVSRLPLASHSDKEIVAALDSLEQECLHLPLGLTMGQGGLVSEFAAAAPNGLPRSAKKRTKKGDQSDRLFAIGEDAGLAALRSSLAVLAAAEATSSTANLQFWTTDAERLLPVAADVRRCIPGNVRFEVVVAAGLWDDQQTAKVDLLAQELSSMQQAIDLSIHRLQLAEAAVAAKVRRALRRSLPLRLGLAGGLSVSGSQDRLAYRPPAALLAAARPAGAQNTMTPILVMGPNECVFPDCSSMAFPVLGDSDLVFFISYGEIVQWLINGSSPTLAAKSAAAVPFSTPFIDGTHASTQQRSPTGPGEAKEQEAAELPAGQGQADASCDFNIGDKVITSSTKKKSELDEQTGIIEKFSTDKQYEHVRLQSGPKTEHVQRIMVKNIRPSKRDHDDEAAAPEAGAPAFKKKKGKSGLTILADSLRSLLRNSGLRMATCDIALERVHALLKIDAGSGSLYNHIVKLARTLAQEKPEDALAQVEALSRRLKEASFRGAEAPEDRKTCAKGYLELVRSPSDITAAPRTLGFVQNFLEDAAMFEWAGVGFGKQESYHMAMSLRALAANTPGLESLRLWGKAP
ncbi:Radial spoke head protein 4-like A [Symbiodinium microadriaticum]|uniref:Radial spoke head protein 4-like A n=1 Tax=Symbiodinium microadriaticum TaxID=2951 RepID=A0A1Q9DDU3_SYMMI|nr:Radial spoke head protein 4-like A [Symbiodinium microadriaticum]